MTDLETGKSLLFGSFECIDPTREDVSVTVLAEGTTWGNPQPIEVAIRSLIQQGTNVVTQGWNNRDGTSVRVKFKATDLDKIAAAEEELMAQVGKRNTLTWTPPNGLGAPTQFVIVTSSLDYIPNDVAEAQYPPSAQYSIRFIAEPFPRSTVTLKAPALDLSGTTRVPVDPCTGTTPWTGFPNDPTLADGGVAILGPANGLTRGIWAGTIDVDDLKYLEVAWLVTSTTGADYTLASRLQAFVGDQELQRVAQSTGSDGLMHGVYLVPDSITSITALRFERRPIGAAQAGDPTQVQLAFRDLAVSDIRPTIGTARQVNRVIDVEGSAPAEGTLVIEHETDALGEALIYLYAEEYAGYLPSLSNRRVSGEARTDIETLVSGKYNSLGSDDVYEIPVTQLPDGSYVLMAHLGYIGGSPAAQRITWEASVRIDGVTVSEVTTGETIVDFTAIPYAPTGFGVVLLGDMQLPDWQTGTASIAVVRLKIHADGLTDVLIDDAWLFNVDIGYLTHVRCGIDDGTGDGPTRLWLLPATIETDIPRLLIGYAADQSDAFHPSAAALGSWMPPYFEPPAAILHLVTTNALAPSAALEHQPRWHTRARRVIGQ